MDNKYTQKYSWDELNAAIHFRAIRETQAIIIKNLTELNSKEKEISKLNVDAEALRNTIDDQRAKREQLIDEYAYSHSSLDAVEYPSTTSHCNMKIWPCMHANMTTS